MMDTDMMIKLKRSIVNHEGIKRFPYTDTMGNITIGIGYNLTNRGIEDEWINKHYLEDINYFYSQLSEFPWFHRLNEDRQIVLIDMAFMGWRHFMAFHKMITALEEEDYDKAAKEMLDSKWAMQVKLRAITLADAMRSGRYVV